MKNNWRCLTKHKSKWDKIMIDNRKACHRTTNQLGNPIPVFEGFDPKDLVIWLKRDS